MHGDESNRPKVPIAARADGFSEALREGETLEGETLVGKPDSFLGDVLEGTLLGPYRLLREIGRGGMGSVYLAMRDDDEYQKRVAVKLLRKGMDSEDLVRRFRNERQILAAVEHPSIAKLYDGGTTSSGNPYLVMELVEGLPLDRHCDAHRLSIRQRLELFLEVCSAVQVAHQNLVVHRDLKPSNILVTAEGVPKLLDFGIAKLLDPDLAGATVLRTAFQRGVMTPGYASPEQVRGEPITTASDVYSLGVVLYELLSGHRPYRVSSHSVHELTRVVCEVEPVRPSQKISREEVITTGDGAARRVTPEMVSRSRGENPDGLRRRLSGDLDNIVMMALRKEPQRRYASVEQLAEDIERHLEGRPVRARRPTLVYRSSKFLGRHWPSVTAAALVVVLLAAFAVVTVRARARAEAEAAKAQAINDFLQETLAAAAPFSGVGREVTVVEALDRAVEELDGAFAGEPDVRAAIQKTLGTTYRELGRLDEAEPLLVEALATRREIHGESHPDVADSLYDLAKLEEDRGLYQEAERLLRQALQMHRQHLGEGEAVARDLDSLAVLLCNMGDCEPAEVLQRESLAWNREASAEGSERLATALNNLALILEKKGDFAAAESLLREVLAMDRERYGDQHPHVATITNNLGILLFDASGHEAAEPFLREALSIRRATLGEHPDTAASLQRYAQVLFHRGDAEESEDLLREALAMQRRLLGNDHIDLTVTMSDLAETMVKTGRHAEAAALHREAIAIMRKELGDDHPDLAISFSNLAYALEEEGDDEEAEALQVRACSLFEESLGPRHWMTGYCHFRYGSFLLRKGRYEEAESKLLAANAILEEALGKGHDRTVQTAESLAVLYRAWNKTEKAGA